MGHPTPKPRDRSVVERRGVCLSEVNSGLDWRASAEGASSSNVMIDTAWPFDQIVIPIDEAALSRNHSLIHAIVSSEVSGPAMSRDEFTAWLDKYARGSS